MEICMTTKELSDSIKRGDFKRVYLLYGEERYLVNHYAETMAATLGEPDNFDNTATAAKIITTADHLPFLSEKRMVRIRDSKLFVSGRKADSEAMTAYLPNVPDSTVLVFAESEVDRRGRLYKKAAELGAAVECETPSLQVLTTWLTRIFKESGKTIDQNAASLLIRYTAHNMTALIQKTKKTAAYAGNRTAITTRDVEDICSPTLQTRVFDLISAMANGRTADALGMYHDMLLMKEQPLMILSMIIRQFRILLMVKTANDKRMPKAQMAKSLGLRSFIVDEALSQSRRFTIEKLFHALISCQDTDYKVKTGLINAEIGVELLILQY